MVRLGSIATIAVVILMADAAWAQIGPFRFFPEDLTVSTALPTGTTRDGIIGYNGRDEDGMFIEPSDPTITFVENGSWSRHLSDLYAYNDSTVNIAGGSIGNIATNVSGLNTFNTSTVNLTTGYIRRHNAFNESKLIMSGGTLGSVNGANDSTLVISGGTVTGLEIRDRASATVSNASVHSLSTVGGTISMTGGSITQALAGGTDNVASIDLTDVAASGVLQASRNGTLTATGGSARNVLVGSDGTLIVDGTMVSGNVTSLENGEINLSSNSVGGSVDVGSNSTINLIDTNVASLSARGDATITQSGGVVRGNVQASENSTIALSEVTVVGNAAATGNIQGSGTSSLLLTGGRIEGDANVAGGGILTVGDGTDIDGMVNVSIGKFQMNPGAIIGSVTVNQGEAFLAGMVVGGNVSVSEFGKLTIGGAVNIVGDVSITAGSSGTLFSGTVTGNVNVDGNDSSTTFAIHGGNVVSGNVQAVGGSRLIMTDGTIAQELIARDGSRIEISGGNIADKVSVRLGFLNISGGIVAGDVISVGGTVDVSGGVVASLHASDGSTITMSNGVVSGEIHSFDTSQVAISGGFVNGSIFRSGTGSFLISGGAVLGIAQGFGMGIINRRGGTIFEGVELLERGQLSMNGGQIGATVTAFQNSTVHLANGRIGGDLRFYSMSRGTITGGTINGSIFAHETSTLNMSGGTILGTLMADSGATVTISGHVTFGTPPPAIPEGLGSNGFAAGLVPASGEGPTSRIFMHDHATLKIIGTDLIAELVDPNYQGLFSLYQLTGTFADGAVISGEFFAIQNGTGATYHLLPPVPEPASLTLALVGLGIFGEVRRRRNVRHVRGGISTANHASSRRVRAVAV